jgi:hypothetical protein
MKPGIGPIVVVLMLVFGAATAAAQAPAPTDPTARMNVQQSAQYERALRTNKAFREKRMQQECGSIDDPALHASCIASFQADEGGRK